MQTQTTTILVLGANGRLGKLLRRYWARQRPAGCDIWFQSRTALTGANTIIWSPGQAPGVLPRCDTVVALWGKTAGTGKDMALNTTLADQARAVALACGAERLLHLSSAAIYGPAQKASEAVAPNPVAAYGQSKLDMEQRVATYRNDPLRHTCLRLANVVGADSLAPALVGSAPVILDRFPDCLGPRRSYIGAGDLADVLTGLARLPAHSLPPILNVAAPEPIAMQDLAAAAGKEIIWRKAPASALQTVTVDSLGLIKLLPAVTPSNDPQALICHWRALLDKD